jgi:hypothetical protein
MSALISLHRREKEEEGRREGGREGGRESNTIGSWMMDKCAVYEVGWVSRSGCRLG